MVQVSAPIQLGRAEMAVEMAHVGRWILGLFAIALCIRLTNLAAKPAWMDEVSTVMFSLGNYSRLIPTDQVISLSEITRALQITPQTTAIDAATYLLAENNHPPAYFMVAHEWMMLFHWLTGKAAAGTYASLWAARALPAFFGALAVPMTYWLAWLSFHNQRTGVLCASMMALSPFSVFLSQEARHYTLAILIVMGSLCCFVLALQAAAQYRPMRWLTVWIWIGLNALGVAVHYFCAIAYLSQGLVLLWRLVQQCLKDRTAWRRAHWMRIYVAAVGTTVGVLVWLPILLHFYGSPQTTYIAAAGARGLSFWLGPIVQSVVGWLYTVMSPVTRGFSWQAVTVIVVTSVLLLLVYAPWLIFHLVRSLKFQWQQSAADSAFPNGPQTRLGLLATSGFFIAANIVYFAICYIVGFDITRGHRYTFAYYPSVVILVGAGLSPFLSDFPLTFPSTFLSQETAERSQETADIENDTESDIERAASRHHSMFSRVRLPIIRRFISGRGFVATVLLIAFLGTQAIVFNRTNLKFYMPDRLVDLMQETSTYPVVLGTEVLVGDQPSVIGNEIVSVAWEIQRQQARASEEESDAWVSEPQFLILKDQIGAQSNPAATLAALVAQTPKPFDLWMLAGAYDLTASGCSMIEAGNKGSYRHTHYICRDEEQEGA
ncbi:MAG: phospholipid carrier-dependent glycosyltransferase [Phormidesmis sp.]